MGTHIRLRLGISVLAFIGTTMALVGAFGPWGGSNASAFGSYKSAVVNRYGVTGSRIDTCGLCHMDSNDPGLSFNAYGAAIQAEMTQGSTAAAAAAAIESLDSDGDGTSNKDEFTAFTMPGLTCTTYTQTSGAPADLVNYVDPNKPGCAAPTPMPTSPPATATPTQPAATATATATTPPSTATATPTATSTRPPSTATATRTATPTQPPSTATATRSATATQPPPTATRTRTATPTQPPSPTVRPPDGDERNDDDRGGRPRYERPGWVRHHADD